MRINYLILKELIKRGYSLEDGIRIWNIFDSKLLYFTPDQIEAFQKMESSVDYQKKAFDNEVRLIKKHIGVIERGIGNEPYNLIDLGCGDGKKAATLLTSLKSKSKLRYCAIDVSDLMIKKAFENLEKLNLNEFVEFKWNLSDFESLSNISELLREGQYKNHLVLLLGNILCNFEITELLYDLRSAMKSNDVLVVGASLDNLNLNELIKNYRNEETYKFFFALVSKLGFKESDLEYNVRLKNSRMEAYFTVKSDTKISFLDKTIYFSKGDQIITGVSYKYRKEELASFIKLYFDDIEILTSDDNSYALILCRK